MLQVALTLHPEEYLGVPDLEFNVDPLEFDNGLSEKDVRKFGGGSALENPSMDEYGFTTISPHSP